MVNASILILLPQSRITAGSSSGVAGAAPPLVHGLVGVHPLRRGTGGASEAQFLLGRGCTTLVSATCFRVQKLDCKATIEIKKEGLAGDLRRGVVQNPSPNIGCGGRSSPGDLPTFGADDLLVGGHGG